jgi:hypothetical protein
MEKNSLHGEWELETDRLEWKQQLVITGRAIAQGEREG